ncbi:hypothetical protein AVEN_166474-1, partial [Araneus ventricosus]
MESDEQGDVWTGIPISDVQGSTKEIGHLCNWYLLSGLHKTSADVNGLKGQ